MDDLFEGHRARCSPHPNHTHTSSFGGHLVAFQIVVIFTIGPDFFPSYIYWAIVSRLVWARKVNENDLLLVECAHTYIWIGFMCGCVCVCFALLKQTHAGVWGFVSRNERRWFIIAVSPLSAERHSTCVGECTKFRLKRIGTCVWRRNTRTTHTWHIRCRDYWW